MVLNRPAGYTFTSAGGSFGVQIDFDKPFIYDPSLGNLPIDGAAAAPDRLGVGHLRQRGCAELNPTSAPNRRSLAQALK